MVEIEELRLKIGACRDQQPMINGGLTKLDSDLIDMERNDETVDSERLEETWTVVNNLQAVQERFLKLLEGR